MEPLAIPSSGGARPEAGKGARRRKPVRLPAAGASEMLLIRIAPRDTGLFRYLLEGGGGHLAMLTVLDPRAALFKLLFSPHQREELEALLESMRKTVPFEVRRWPVKTPRIFRSAEPCRPAGTLPGTKAPRPSRRRRTAQRL